MTSVAAALPVGRAGLLARWASACLLLATMVMPVYGCRAHPQDFDPQENHAVMRWSKTTPDDVPVVTIAEEAFGALRTGDVVGVV